MPLSFWGAVAVRKRRRRSVRIARPRSQVHAIRFTFLLVFAVGLSLLLIYRTWQPETPPSAEIRGLADVEMDWKCDGGHLFRIGGRTEPVACPTCGKDAFPVTTYLCEQHGPIEVLFRFFPKAEGEEGQPQVRLGLNGWKGLDEGLKCPKCERDLDRPVVDPIQSLTRSRK
ncbi:MAG: hypothetical protein AABZ47_11830 [Planctomycetota bacterium]